MPRLTFAVAPDGLMMPALVGPDARAMQKLLARNKPVPKPIQVRSQIDTGSVVTEVGPGILTALSATPGGSSRTQTASGVAMVRFYRISFTIFEPKGVTMNRSTWVVTDLPQNLPDVEVLFGMDLVRQLVLNVDGPSGQFTLDC
jgi:hypothetical protein